MQTVLSAIIVAGCAGYAVWTLLLPSSARRRVLGTLGKDAPAPRTCGACAGCDHGKAAYGHGPQRVHWLPRQRG